MAYFNYIRTFITVYRTGSYGAAADHLNMTHPTVSKHIEALEHQLGKPLFKRHASNGGKSYKPTKAARDLARELSPHIDRIEEIYIATRGRTKDLTGSVHIGGLVEFAEMIVTNIIAFLTPHNIRSIVQYESADHWIDMLKDQTVDIAILPMPINSELIGYKEIITDPLMLVAHPDSIKHQERDILDLPYIAFSPELPCMKQYLAALSCNEETLKICAKAGSFRMIRNMLIQNRGFSIMPKCFVEEDLEQGILIDHNHISAPIYMRLYLAWNKNSMQKPRNIFVRDAILEAIKTAKKCQ